MRSFVPLFALALAGGLAVASAAHAVDVTACGQVVVGTGDLRADLDCSAHPGPFAVQLIGRLRLNGFTVRGNPAHPVVYCNTGPCTVFGLGTLWGGADGIRSDVGAKVVDAQVGSNVGDGIRAQRAIRVLGYALVDHNGGAGVRSAAQVAVIGAQGATISISGNGGDGIHAARGVRLKRVALSGNEQSGVVAGGTIAANRAFISGSARDGARGLRVQLMDATAIGNGTGAGCDPSTCADLASTQRPGVAGVSLCETSRRTDGSGDWDVCSED